MIALPRWKTTFVASWLAQVCSIIGFSMVVPFLPFYVRELGVHDERSVLLWSGWGLAGSAGLTMALLAPFWGVMADRYGRKLMVMRSMFGGMVVLTLMALVQNIWQLFALRILQGALTGTVSASVALVSSVVPERRAGFALGLMQTALMVGNSLGPWIGGHCAEHFGYRVPFLFAGVFLLAGGLLTVFGVHEGFDPEEARQAEQFGSLRGVIMQAGFPSLIGLLFMVQFVSAFTGPILPLYIEKLSHLPTGQAAGITGNIFGVAGLAAAVSAAIIGRLSDTWGHGRVLTGCMVLTGLALFPHALAQNTDQLLGLRILVALASAGITPSANAIIRALIPRSACGKAFGIVQSFTCLGWGIGPAVGSSLAAGMGMRLPFVVVGAAFLLTSALAAAVLPRTQQHIVDSRAAAEGLAGSPGPQVCGEQPECGCSLESPK